MYESLGIMYESFGHAAIILAICIGIAAIIKAFKK